MKELVAPIPDKVAEYLAHFELTLSDLTGPVLDVGAGQRLFAKECMEMGIMNIYSLEHNEMASAGMWDLYEMARRMGRMSSELELWKKTDVKSITAQAEHIPVANGFFKLVLTHDAIPVAVDRVDTIFKELLRITAPHGTIKIYPLYMDTWQPNKKEHVQGELEKMKQRTDVVVIEKAIVRTNPWIGRQEQGVYVTINKLG